MRKLFTSLSLFAALAVPSVAVAAPGAEVVAPAPGPSAMETFQASHKSVDKAVDAGADEKALETLVDALLDYKYLTEAALGGPKKYAKRCGDRCVEFNDLLTKLIRRNYLKRISAKDNGAVVVIREEIRMKKGKAVAKVDTVVTFTSPDDGHPITLEVSYVMHEVDGRWQVRDMYTDGLSLARTWKHDFTELFKEGGIDLVITRLQGKLTELDDLAKN